MKGIIGICVLFSLCSTVAVAQEQKSRTARPKSGQHIRTAGNAKGEFTRRETATVRRVERNARRWERRNEKDRLSENNRRKIDARRMERSDSRKKS
jgi:hypothetical protein